MEGDRAREVVGRWAEGEAERDGCCQDQETKREATDFTVTVDEER